MEDVRLARPQWVFSTPVMANGPLWPADDEVGGPERAQDRAPLSWTNEGADTLSSASKRGRQRLAKRDPRERSEQSETARAAHRIVRPFTNALEWRCLDRIRAPIQELCVANLPD
jgi:hypothetical protein